MLDLILKFITWGAAIFAVVWALYLYNRQQKFKRLQNLSERWKEFFRNDEMLSLFSLMNEIESDESPAGNLSAAPAKQKLQFLAIIEEVALYAEQFEIDRPYAGYLFQWHFAFVYRSQKTTAAFWDNLGGEQEMNAAYWKKSRKLAGNKDFLPEMSV